MLARGGAVQGHLPCPRELRRHHPHQFQCLPKCLGVNCRQDVLRQFSIVSMELFNIVEDIKNVSKVFVVYLRNVNAKNATIQHIFCVAAKLLILEEQDGGYCHHLSCHSFGTRSSLCDPKVPK
ncbi:hypothetical protein BDA96_06G080300 [Sorghum bicolor]|uniref:Uncharacterized protein n=2 Tax=Sorghum bicolor TaxID=4558 RepID=A0A921QRS0_SORBI|nr:hypothetical protein BDA96_06G080300 [Sorghum bicolor]OQU81535.1 hypothetical protein SORBI_3006G073001 [Sorghum bicolor]